MRTVLSVRLALSASAIALFACRHPQPAVYSETRAVRVDTLALAADELSIPQYITVAARIRTLRADPPQIDLVVGQQLSFARALRITALDSAGQVLGRLTHVDQALQPGAAVLDGFGQVRGVQPGGGVLVVTAPLFNRYGGQGSPPRLEVPVTVRP